MSTKHNIPSNQGSKPSVIKKSTHKTAHLTSAQTPQDVLHLTLTTSSSPDSPSPSAMETDDQSPTVRIGGMGKVAPGTTFVSRVGMLRRLSSGNGSEGSADEDEGTPTKGGGERVSLAGALLSRRPPGQN